MKNSKKEIDKLLYDIDRVSLSKILPRALRLVQRLNEKDFEHWIRLELNGYFNSNPELKEKDIVPPYRTIAGQHSDDFGRPLIITDPKLSFINETRLRFEVEELEGISHSDKPISFRDPVMSSIIKEHLNINVTLFTFNPKQVVGILTGIKTRLSDFLVEIDSRINEKKASSSQGKEVEEILELHPNIYGMGINLKALIRKWRAWNERRKGKA